MKHYCYCIRCHKPCATIVNAMCLECWRAHGAPKLQDWLEKEHGFDFSSEKKKEASR